MLPLHPKKKVEIVIDSAATEEAVALIERSGAKGHTVVRGIRTGHDIFEHGQNDLIIVVTRPEVAERIVRDVMRLLESFAGVAYVSDVQVVRDDHF